MTPKTTLKDLSCQSCSSRCSEVTKYHDGYQKMQLRGEGSKGNTKYKEIIHINSPISRLRAYSSPRCLLECRFLCRKRDYFAIAVVLQTLPDFISLHLQVHILFQLRPEPSEILWSPNSTQVHTNVWQGGGGALIIYPRLVWAFNSPLQELKHPNNLGWRLIKDCKECCSELGMKPGSQTERKAVQLREWWSTRYPRAVQ